MGHFERHSGAGHSRARGTRDRELSAGQQVATSQTAQEAAVNDGRWTRDFGLSTRAVRAVFVGPESGVQGPESRIQPGAECAISTASSPESHGITQRGKEE